MKISTFLTYHQSLASKTNGPWSKHLFRTSKRQLAIFVLFWLWVGAAFPVRAQSQNAAATLKLKFSVAPETTTYWKVLGAGLVEEPQGTTGSLKVQNISDITVNNAVFYAEYFDNQARLCFSLVFSQSTNTGAERTPIPAGAIRSLYSGSAGMVPASTPTEVRIHLILQGAMGQNPSQIETIPLESPVTLGSNVPSDKASIQLPPELASTKDPVLDLVLARVNVDQDGAVRETKVLYSVSPEVEDWFESFVSELNFYPATVDGRPKDADALISVQAILSRSLDVSSSQLVPKWGSAYVSSLKDTEVPPVTRILFGVPSDKIQLSPNAEYVIRERGRPGDLEVLRLGSEWSDTAYKWVQDESMPQHLARQLAGNSSPK